jgi:membrane-associated protein
MPYPRFQTYNVLGALSWVSVFLGGGYLFGNIPWVRENFGLVTLGIVGASLIPLAVVALRSRWRH